MTFLSGANCRRKAPLLMAVVAVCIAGVVCDSEPGCATNCNCPTQQSCINGNAKRSCCWTSGGKCVRRGGPGVTVTTFADYPGCNIYQAPTGPTDGTTYNVPLCTCVQLPRDNGISSYSGVDVELLTFHTDASCGASGGRACKGVSAVGDPGCGVPTLVNAYTFVDGSDNDRACNDQVQSVYYCPCG